MFRRRPRVARAARRRADAHTCACLPLRSAPARLAAAGRLPALAVAKGVPHVVHSGSACRPWPHQLLSHFKPAPEPVCVRPFRTTGNLSQVATAHGIIWRAPGSPAAGPTGPLVAAHDKAAVPRCTGILAPGPRFAGGAQPRPQGWSAERQARVQRRAAGESAARSGRRECSAERQARVQRGAAGESGARSTARGGGAQSGARGGARRPPRLAEDGQADGADVAEVDRALRAGRRAGSALAHLAGGTGPAQQGGEPC